MKKRVLFVCIGNSGRSQMAEAFFERASGRWSVVSAGIEPDERIHPLTVEVMKKAGIDLSRRKPKRLTDEMLTEAHRIVVMDSRVMSRLPSQYLSKTENWEIKSLLGKNRTQVEEIGDEIRKKVEQLTEELETSERKPVL